MSIALFLLLSGFFLAALLGSVERNRKLLGAAGAFLVAIVCIIVFLKPVQLPSLQQLRYGENAIAVPAAHSTAPGAAGSSGVRVPATAAPGTTASGPGQSDSGNGAGTAQAQPAEVASVR